MTIAVRLLEAVKAGYNEFRRLPPILEKTPIYVNENIPPISSLPYGGYHGTKWSSDIESQLRAGIFAKRYRHIFYGNIHQAVQFGRQHTDKSLSSVVILQVCSKNRPWKNKEHFTYYFPGGPDQEVYIIAAYRLSQDFINAKGKSLQQRITDSLAAARTALQTK